MNEQTYWNKLLESNPAMKKDIVTLKTRSLRLVVSQAYQKGYNARAGEEDFKDTDLGKMLFGNKKGRY